ncbi:YFE9 [Hepatospora eriocheir]|uniref:YFE9 n=1 Tax=Hepatospora eriocheir TaxID=1081669 RepID=A0A1X0QD46_9MICR|nr:YFE9 [Hepatospora eriocheir]
MSSKYSLLIRLLDSIIKIQKLINFNKFFYNLSRVMSNDKECIYSNYYKELRYLSIRNTQKVLKYIFNEGKKQPWFKLNNKPTNIGLILIKDELEDNDVDNFIQKKLNLESIIHLSECNLSLEIILKHILYDFDEECEDFKGIDMNLLKKYIPMNNINHLFSYSAFIRTQERFDISKFDSFYRPIKNTKYSLIALDCEMVETEIGVEVGKIAILDKNGSLIYNKIVKPNNLIIDYRTDYSGLTKKSFELDFISYKMLIEDLQEIIGTNTIVVGHGLENDLGTLKFYTTNVIDTAYLFINSLGLKIGLNILCKKYLKYEIQKGSHNPYEDALCTLKLLDYKIQKINILLNGKRELILKKVKVIEDFDEFINSIDSKNSILGKFEVNNFNDVSKFKDKTYLIVFYKKGNKYYIAFKNELIVKKGK